MRLKNYFLSAFAIASSLLLSAEGYGIDSPTLQATDDASSYDEVHTWAVDKTVGPEMQSGYAGETLPWTWSIDIFESVVDETFRAGGQLTLTNNDPDETLLVALTATLSGGTGGNSVIGVFPNSATNCNLSSGIGGVNWTLPPSTTGTCNYISTVTWDSLTAAANNGDFRVFFIDSGSIGERAAQAVISISYAANPIDGSATLTDGTLQDQPVSGGDTYSIDDQAVCSYSRDGYDVNGQYTDNETNTAVLTTDGQTIYEDSATTSWVCEAGFSELLKTTNGQVDATQIWSFELFEGPAGFGGTVVGTDSSDGKTDGILDFNAALSPGASYTVCEVGIPSGWRPQWLVDSDGDGTPDAPVTAYNPDAADGSDLGNRCIEVGAGTAFTVTVGNPLAMAVDNIKAQENRSKGYWKNWNECTPGRQAYVAASNGGTANGFWLLDDIIPISIGPLQLGNCEDAVAILNKQDIETGSRHASDAAYLLASQLAAAKANVATNGGVCQEAADTIAMADDLLSSLGFDGTGDYLRGNHGQARQARYLAATLEAFNQNLLCPTFNLLANPGFEDPITADGPPFVGLWQAFSRDDDEQTGPDVARTSVLMPRTGLQSLELGITNTANTFAGVFQDVEGITPGQPVMYGGWHRVNVGPGGIEIRIEWRDSVTNTEISRTPDLTPTPGSEYESFYLEGVVPVGADTARLVYAIQSIMGGAATQLVYVDDVSFIVEED